MLDLTRSQDFRTVFANAFSVTMTPTEVHIVCGIQHNIETAAVDMEAQVALVTTHEAAKLLSALFALLVDERESQIGRAIEFDPSKLDGLKAIINVNRAQTGRPLLP